MQKMPFLGTHLRQLAYGSRVAASPPSAPVPGLSVEAATLEHRLTSRARTASAAPADYSSFAFGACGAHSCTSAKMGTGWDSGRGEMRFVRAPSCNA